MTGRREFWLDAIRAEGAVFAATIDGGDLDRPVPTRPDWTLGDLIWHLGRGYWRCRTTVSRGTTSRPEEMADPDRPAELLPWWQSTQDQLLDTFAQLADDYPAWNWAPQPKILAFWLRRMAHETALHRWDAQVTRGRAEPLDTALAVDGVAEVLDTWLPAGRRRVQGEVHGMVQLVATDTDHEWFVRFRGEAVALLDTDTLVPEEYPVTARAVGTASDLDLALWGRVPFDVLDLAGETAIIEALRPG